MAKLTKKEKILVGAVRCRSGRGYENWKNKRCQCGSGFFKAKIIIYDDLTEPIGTVQCPKCEREYCLICGDIMEKQLRKDLPIIKEIPLRKLEDLRPEWRIA